MRRRTLSRRAPSCRRAMNSGRMRYRRRTRCRFRAQRVGRLSHPGRQGLALERPIRVLRTAPLRAWHRAQHLGRHPADRASRRWLRPMSRFRSLKSARGGSRRRPPEARPGLRPNQGPRQGRRVGQVGLPELHRPRQDQRPSLRSERLRQRQRSRRHLRGLHHRRRGLHRRHRPGRLRQRRGLRHRRRQGRRRHRSRRQQSRRRQRKSVRQTSRSADG